MLQVGIATTAVFCVSTASCVLHAVILETSRHCLAVEKSVLSMQSSWQVF